MGPTAPEDSNPEESSMDFRLNDEQKQIQQMVKDFAESELKPHVMEWDEAQHFPVETFKHAGGLG